MLRVGIFAVIGLSAVFVGQTADAQVVIAPRMAPSNSHSRLRDQLARREFQRQGLRAAALRRGITPGQLIALDRLLDEERLQDDQFNEDFRFGPTLPSVVFVPSATRATMDPFAGDPYGGNYFYWLSRQYGQGRISKADYNRQVYGIGRK